MHAFSIATAVPAPVPQGRPTATPTSLGATTLQEVSIGMAAGIRVLIVTDDDRLREQFMRVTGDGGYVSGSVPNAHAALRAMASSPHDVAVIDLSMPTHDGQDLLERIRRRWAWVQLILVNGVMDEDTTKRGIRYDAADFLTRPCSQREIAAALGRACRRRLGDPALQATRARCATPAVLAAVDRCRPLEEIEREHILAAVVRSGGNREHAANELGISVRKLYYRLQQYAREGFRLMR